MASDSITKNLLLVLTIVLVGISLFGNYVLLTHSFISQEAPKTTNYGEVHLRILNEGVASSEPAMGVGMVNLKINSNEEVSE
ncbi:MAG: hypothetical protein KAS04_00575 [Candidatus Aenigmarchaeota archaeon]|nr:hypothetical protein [Candidatus Aenigmarchaeota archaeon]